MRRIINMVLFIVLVLPISLFATNTDLVLPKGVIKIQPEKAAPALRLSNMDGVVTDLQTFRGRWVMVHFWASWCGPCRKEIPSIQRLSKQLVPADIVLVMVNTAEKEDDVVAFLFGAAPELDTLMDADGVVTNRWQPRGLPSSFFVDPEGKLRYLALGGRPWHTKPYLTFIRSLTSHQY